MSANTAGLIAIGAGGVAVLGLIVSALLAARLGRIRSAQQTVAGEGGERTLVEAAAQFDQRLGALADQVDETVRRLEEQDGQLDLRLQGAITKLGVVRYDAMGEMTGRQSSSVALLDEHGTGVVLSSILHREQARLYAKPINQGQSEFELSPEETEALETAKRPGT